MFKWVKYLFRHRHNWQTTHVNRYQHPTRQMCKCGLVRDIETVKFGECKWVYSDGTESEVMDWGEQ